MRFLIFTILIIVVTTYGENPVSTDSLHSPIPKDTTQVFTKSRVSFHEPIFSVGHVPRNTKLTHSFSYGVSAVDTVKIIRTSSSCGCTYAKIPEKKLVPRSTGSIEVTYTTGMIEGPFEKSFTLYTNSKSTPKIELILKGSVHRYVYTNPPVLHLDECQLGSQWNKDITIVWKRQTKPGFKPMKTVPEFLKAGNLFKDQNDPTKWHLVLSLSKQAQARYYQDTIRIMTSDTTWPQIVIPTQGTIADYFMTKPLVVNMGQVKKGTPTSNSFLVVSAKPRAKIVSIKSSKPYILASLGKTIEPGKKFRINLKTTGTPPAGSIATNIMVKITADGIARELKVPVVGRFLN